MANSPHLLKFGVLLFQLHQILYPLLVVLVAHQFAVLFWQVVHLFAENVNLLWDTELGNKIPQAWYWYTTPNQPCSYIEELLLFLLPLAQFSQLQTAVPQFTGELLDTGLRLGQHGLLGLQSNQHQRTPINDNTLWERLVHSTLADIYVEQDRTRLVCTFSGLHRASVLHCSVDETRERTMSKEKRHNEQRAAKLNWQPNLLSPLLLQLSEHGLFDGFMQKHTADQSTRIKRLYRWSKCPTDVCSKEIAFRKTTDPVSFPFCSGWSCFL